MSLGFMSHHWIYCRIVVCNLLQIRLFWFDFYLSRIRSNILMIMIFGSWIRYETNKKNAHSVTIQAKHLKIEIRKEKKSTLDCSISIIHPSTCCSNCMCRCCCVLILSHTHTLVFYRRKRKKIGQEDLTIEIFIAWLAIFIQNDDFILFYISSSRKKNSLFIHIHFQMIIGV